MHTTDPIQSGLLSMIYKIVGRCEPIPVSTSLYHDLHIAAEDAVKLIGEIARRFNVSFTGFELSRYFPDEDEAGWLYFATLLGWRDTTRQQLTLGHLIAVIRKGCWFAPASA